MNFEAFVPFIASTITVLGGMYSIARFMTKDIRRDIEIHSKEFEEFKKEMQIIHAHFDRQNARLDAQNARLDAHSLRLDGLYTILISKKESS